MTTSVEELPELALYTPEQAAVIMSGDTPGAVTGHWIRDQIADGRCHYTPIGRRKMLSREDIRDLIAVCRVVPVNRAPKRRGR